MGVKTDPIDLAREAIQQRLDECASCSKLRGVLANLDELFGEREEAPAERRPRKPRKKPAKRSMRAAPPVERAHGNAHSSPTREAVLAVVRELSAASDDDGWIRSAAVEERVGSGGVRPALYRLRELGLVEDNGRRTSRARWRAVAKGKRSKPAAEPAPDDAPAPAIIHRDVKPPKSNLRRLPLAPLVPAKPGETAFRMGDGSTLSLEVVAVSELTKPEQRFKCVPFSAIITAGTCLERQKIAGAQVRIGEGKGVGARTREIEASSNAKRFHRCADCALGREVRARLEAV